jgi:hypothetical protein
MTNVLRHSAALAVCVLVFGWSVPLASGSETQASGPSGSVGPSPSGSTSYSPVTSRFSLTVSPTRIAVVPTDIGEPIHLLVVNRGQSPVPVTVSKRSFTGGADGALLFQDTAPYSAANWVTVSPVSFELATGASQAVTATITVAPHPEPGDHQVAIVFLVPAGQSEANVRINRGIAVPVYVTVLGATNNATSVSGLTAPGFVMSGTVAISATVHDTGTVHRDFRGATQMIIGGAGSPAAFPDFTVLRGSFRDISTTWNPPLMCICHPSVSIAKADGSVQTTVIRVIVFPLYQLGIIIVALLVLALVIRQLRRRYRTTVRNAAAHLNQRAGPSNA